MARKINPEPDDPVFEVQGAGGLIVEAIPGIVQVCGTARGVGIACTWGRHGTFGGVMDRLEVERLVEYLQKWLAVPDEDEEVQDGGQD